MKKPGLLVLGASLVALAAAAIEPPQTVPAPAPAPPAESSETAATTEVVPTDAEPADDAGAPADSPADAEEGEEALPPLPAGTVPAGPPPQRFNPTEKVRADFPVSFPIDI